MSDIIWKNDKFRVSLLDDGVGVECVRNDLTPPGWWPIPVSEELYECIEHLAAENARLAAANERAANAEAERDELLAMIAKVTITRDEYDNVRPAIPMGNVLCIRDFGGWFMNRIKYPTFADAYAAWKETPSWDN
jgi:hypothetical protein